MSTICFIVSNWEYVHLMWKIVFLPFHVFSITVKYYFENCNQIPLHICLILWKFRLGLCRTCTVSEVNKLRLRGAAHQFGFSGSAGCKPIDPSVAQLSFYVPQDPG